MDLAYALSRIKWRFKECDVIYVNEKDSMAIETILSFLALKQKKEKSNISFFYNLYTHSLLHLIKRFETCIEDPLPHKELHKILDSPFESRVSELMDFLNLIEQNQVLEYCGLKDYSCHSTIPKETKEKAFRTLESIIRNDAGHKKVFGQSWSFDEVKKGLINQIKNYLDDQD